MNIDWGKLSRRLIPTVAVGGVLTVSFLASAPSLASSSNDVGYGYANNCGVKGDGLHDHGKVCPNRPFPGHGNGVIRILTSLGLSPAINLNAATHKTKANSIATNPAVVSRSVAKGNASATKSHSHANHGHHNGNRILND